MELYFADLHVHTALSRCAEEEMSPPAIVAQARSRGIRILGVCDHNSARNVGAVSEAGRAAGVAVIGGMEVQTREDVHVLTFMRNLDELLEWQDEVYASLPEGENDDDRFGAQLVMDSLGRVTSRERRLLLASVSMSIDLVARRVRRLGGLVVPAHIDRPSFSVTRNLGFLPPDLEPDCVEVSWRMGARRARTMFPWLSGVPLIVSSDAHRLDEIRGYTSFKLDTPSFEELGLAFRSAGGRLVRPADELS